MNTTNPIAGGGEGARGDSMIPDDPKVGADLQDKLAENEEGREVLETEEERYERAKEKLKRDVGHAREELKGEFEAVEKEMRERHEAPRAIEQKKKELAEEKAARIADGFLPTERMSVLRKLLKDVPIAGESEARGKFEFLIMIGFKMKYWSKSDYAFRLNSKTEGIDDDFEDEQKKLEVEFEGLEQAWNAWEAESSNE
jgi:hypothetical protein